MANAATPPADPAADAAAAPAPAAEAAPAPAPAPQAPRTPEERVAQAEALRESGNAKFRAGDDKGARKDYEGVLFRLRREAFDNDTPAELAARVAACRLPTQLNLALCCLRAGSSDAFRALELCEEVLFLDPENVKATYRKGKALVELGELAEAEYELTNAHRLAPGDSAIRQDLEKLRRRMREEKVAEKRAYKGLFARDPGFASQGRAAAGGTAAAEPSAAAKKADYGFIREPVDNPFEGAEHAHREAQVLLDSGRLEEAVWALEAAVRRSASAGDWDAHFECWFELGKHFMDLNIDALALRCLNRAVGFTAAAKQTAARPPRAVRRNALLLRSVCLLNESESDIVKEVSASLALWLAATEAGSDAPSAAGTGEIDERVAKWRQSAGPSADAAVAHGLLHLLHGREDALQAFADALTSPADEESCFGAQRRGATKWNMLGAVLANRGRHDDALVAYGQALALQPHYPRALVNQGIALQAKADPCGALRAFACALELLPPWGSLEVWAMLQKSAQDQPGADGGIAEAVGQRSLPRLRELLGPAAPAAAAGAAPAAEVLRRLGLAPGCAAAQAEA